MTEIEQHLKRLGSEAQEALYGAGFTSEDIRMKHYLNLRYQGTDSAIMTLITPAAFEQPDSIVAAFQAAHQREFGFLLPDRPILVDDIRVRASGRSSSARDQKHTSINFREFQDKTRWRHCEAQPEQVVSVYFEGGWAESPVYQLAQLKSEAVEEAAVCVDGPAMLIDRNSTIVVEPGCHAFVLRDSSVVVLVEKNPGQQQTSESGDDIDVDLVDPIQLSIFSHRFMSIAERKSFLSTPCMLRPCLIESFNLLIEMGRTLQRTSVSVNIKERLDFSCALFGPNGTYAGIRHSVVE